MDDIVTRVHEISHSQNIHGDLELHMIGGFLDKNRFSQELCLQLLSKLFHIYQLSFNIFLIANLAAFNRQLVNIHLLTACVCELNNTIRGNTNWPLLYGVGVNVKTGEIFPASFHEKGPEIPLRSTRYFTGQHDMIDIYDTQTSILKIGPFNYKPMRGVDLWLSQDDNFILEVWVQKKCFLPNLSIYCCSIFLLLLKLSHLILLKT